MFLRKGLESFVQRLSNEYLKASSIINKVGQARMDSLLPLQVEYSSFVKLTKELKSLSTLKGEKELQGLLEEEEAELEKKIGSSVTSIKELVIPHLLPTNKGMTVGILEVRAGSGGDEAAMFASSLLCSYWRHCLKKGISFTVQSLNGSSEPISSLQSVEMVKHAICRLKIVDGGGNSYSDENDDSSSSSSSLIDDLLFETGVHRVQRIPKTDSQGRIHTSTAIVALGPELVEDTVVIRGKDLKIDLFRASGPGGQNVNKVNSAVRITHLPSQIAIAVQEERTAIQNKAIAMNLLQKRLQQLKRAEVNQQRQDGRDSQMGTGNRSEKIRTYNYPQNRITDHRLIGSSNTKYGIESFMEGDFFDEFHQLLKMQRNVELLDSLEK